MYQRPGGAIIAGFEQFQARNEHAAVEMEKKVRCRAAREVKKALRQEAHISTKVGNLRKAVVLWRKDLYTAPLLFTTVQSVNTNMYAHKKKQAIAMRNRTVVESRIEPATNCPLYIPSLEQRTWKLGAGEASDIIEHITLRTDSKNIHGCSLCAMRIRQIV
jgi:hypothetical protein